LLRLLLVVVDRNILVKLYRTFYKNFTSLEFVIKNKDFTCSDLVVLGSIYFQ